MRRASLVVAAVFAATFVFYPTSARAQVAREQPVAPAKALASAEWGNETHLLVEGDPKQAVTFTWPALGACTVLASTWDGTGFFDGKVYRGVYRYLEGVTPPAGVAPLGTHRGTLEADGSLRVHGEPLDGRGRPFDVVWNPDPIASPGAPQLSADPETGLLVDVLPVVIRRVPPHYPEVGHSAGVQETVIVEALVGKDGLVKDASARSIPTLDELALESVRQWVFRPAISSAGMPLEIWVEIPIKFSWH